MGLDEPEGFEIDMRVTDYAYVKCLLSFVEVYKKHRQEEKEIVNSEVNNIENSGVDKDDKQGTDE